MRHVVFLFILILNTAAYTQQLSAPNNKEIIAPVLIKDSKSDEAQLGLFTTEHTEQRPDALTILRRELQRQAMSEQAKAQKDGVFVSVNKRFTPESITFFIAIGGVTFNSMWIKAHGDPLAMERHILSLKDPIAHLSFYAFMQSQGFYMDFRTKKLGVNSMDPLTRKQMMTRLSYQGMAIGSLAASIVADLGQSVKMCTDQWIHGKTDESSLESCNQAWKQWSVRDKFTQYFPQIISLWATQAATTLIESSAAKAFDKVTATSFAKKILNKESLVKTAYKITSADVVLTFVGGGWATKSIKFVGKLTKFSMFVGVDHFLSAYTYRPLNNLIRPLFFDFYASAINMLWYRADQGNWNQANIKGAQSLELFEKEIENYGTQMQQWREHLNSDAEADLTGWMEMTKEILNQTDYAYKFYRGFTGHMFETLNIGYQVQNKQLDPAAATVITQFPLRTLPFYGISTGPYKPIGGQIEDFYLLNPNELEKRQKEHILNTAEKHKIAMRALKGFELKEFNSILEKLLSKDNTRMSSGLNDLNKVNKTEQIYITATGTWEDNSVYSGEFMDAIAALKKELGNPQPVVYPLAGYSQAFAANSVNQISAEAADYSKWSIKNKFKFNKEADLMMYKIICGQPQGRLYKVQLAGVNFLSPQFDPPTLLKANNDRREFCNSSRSTDNLYSTNIADKQLKTYLLENLNYAAIGDYRDKKQANTFENWWLKNAKEPLNSEFRNFDLQYKKLFELASTNYFDQRTFYKFFVDGLNQSRYLPKSLNASLRAESRLYLQILSRVLAAGNPPPPANIKNNYLEFATTSSEQLNYVSLYKQVPREIEKLNDLLAVYSTFIVNKNVNFDGYIAHSKKIDTAINDILVLAGLKRVSQTDADEDLSASASGSENSDKIYEDISVQNPTYKQRMAVTAVRGLRQVESEIRRFIRMKIMLSQSLELDAKEFMNDWNNANPTRPQKAGPFGH